MFRRCLSLILVLFFVSGFSLGAEDFYWEDPYMPISSGASFSKVESGGGLTVCADQEVRSSGDEGGSVTVSVAVSSDGRNFRDNRAVLGPFSFVGRTTDVFSLAVGKDRTIYIALMLPDKPYRSTARKMRDGASPSCTGPSPSRLPLPRVSS
jgi:hypothetical protein